MLLRLAVRLLRQCACRWKLTSDRWYLMRSEVVLVSEVVSGRVLFTFLRFVARTYWLVSPLLQRRWFTLMKALQAFRMTFRALTQTYEFVATRLHTTRFP